MKFGIRVSFSPAFFVFWGAMLALEPNKVTACIAGAMALHEAGHAAALLRLGSRIRELRFGAGGVEMVCAAELSSYRADAAVSLAGPLISLVSGGLALWVGGRLFGGVSLLLGLFNLLPVRGLDGGRALYSLLCPRCLPERAEAVTRGVSLPITVGLWMLAVWIMLATKGNFSLFAVSIMLFATSAFER